ncbi:unnamed protein product [Strongylus vulgaris]|uniref:Heme transporter hrg-1 n=1 Tax=Strongylus vulgaris TaxID=40348 RepID=A0A3P7J1Y8_STRVU|nr:unnamed protein product [Strongylus vulgaris]
MTGYQIYRYDSITPYVDAYKKTPSASQGMCHLPIKVYIAIAILGMIAGYSAALCFGIQYHNFSATTMAFISGVAATVLLYMHLAFKKGKMIDWPRARFTCYLWAGWVTFVIAVIGLTASLIYAGVNHQTLTTKDQIFEGLQGENFWITSVWFFMLAKWTSMIGIFAKRYLNATLIPLSKTPPSPLSETSEIAKADPTF